MNMGTAYFTSLWVHRHTEAKSNLVSAVQLAVPMAQLSSGTVKHEEWHRNAIPIGKAVQTHANFNAYIVCFIARHVQHGGDIASLVQGWAPALVWVA